MVKINYILIDYENVRPEVWAVLDPAVVRVKVFLGENQSKLPLELVQAMQRFGGHGEYLRISGNGKNALDFHLTYYLGEMISKDPKSFYHIISRDTGFDPLVDHLMSRGFQVRRYERIEDIPLPNPQGKKVLRERLAKVTVDLRDRVANWPRSEKTLRNWVAQLFHQELSERELDQLIRGLKAAGEVVLEGNRVVYPNVPASQA